MWVKFLSLPNHQPTMLVKDPTNAYAPICHLNSTGPLPNTFSGAVFTSAGGGTSFQSDAVPNIITQDVWFHYAFSFDMVTGGAAKLYKNGVEVSYFAADVIPPGSSSYDDSGDGWWIGFDDSSFYYNGELSDMRIYNAALSAPQIASIAAGGTPASANLAAWWKFCSGNLLADSSGNGLNLTNFGAVAGASQPPVDICNPAPAPPSAGSVSGNVVISGAEVQIVSDHFDSLKTLIRFTNSDSSGNYSFSGLPIGNYYITALAPGFVYRRRAFAMVDGVNGLTDVNLTPTALNSSNAS
jgi:hypothetical protein